MLYKSAIDLAKSIRQGVYSSEEVVKAHIEQINRHNHKLNAIVHLFDKEAIAEAIKCDREMSEGKNRGPLHGVPVTIKEQFWVKGKANTINAKLFKEYVANEDAVIVKRIRESGAVILGQTNIPKLLLDYQVWGDIYPEGSNPYDLSRTPGGSTGGGAAALSAGFTSLELGGDLGGSVRVPSYFCGLYGLKPTDNTVPRHGNIPIPTGSKASLINFAQAGPLARTPEDMELLWNIIVGPDAGERDIVPFPMRTSTKRNLSDFRIAWVEGWPEHPVSSTVSRAIQNVVHQLIQAGANIVQDKPDPESHDDSLRLWVGMLPYIIALEAPFLIRQLMKRGQKRTIFKNYPTYMDELNRGYQLKAKYLGELRFLKNKVTAAFGEFFDKCDLLICPMGYGPAFVKTKIGNAISYDGQTLPYGKYIWPFVACFNASGHPAMNLPLGMSKEGLPIGVQVVGKYWAEPDMMKFARLCAENRIGKFEKPEGY